MRNIVVTDGLTLNPGDLSWTQFEQLGSIKVFDRTSNEGIVERLKDADIVITNKTIINAETMSLLKRLSLICVTATGYNVVDVQEASRRKIPVCNVPSYGTDSVAQHTFALILALTNHVGANAELVAKGAWSKSLDWCFTATPLIELAGKTLGIVGFGRIGQKTAEIGRVFGMNVIYFNPSPKLGTGVRVGLERLFSDADFISLHCPLTADNKGFVNADLIGKMKSSAFLINTSRGQLINEEHLADALRSRRLGGAALDVLSVEPPPLDHPLIGLSNCIITPHNAWLSFEARKRIMDITFLNIKNAIEGQPQNVVNTE
jgi:glycerate dehydrogenase